MAKKKSAVRRAPTPSRTPVTRRKATSATPAPVQTTVAETGLIEGDENDESTDNDSLPPNTDNDRNDVNVNTRVTALIRAKCEYIAMARTAQTGESHTVSDVVRSALTLYVKNVELPVFTDLDLPT